MNFNPYLVFDVPMSADFELLRATYRRLARENHPDIASDKPLATIRMAQINRAWAILGDREKRAAFDAGWRQEIDEKTRQESRRREVAQREMARSATRRHSAPTSRSNSGAPRASKTSSPNGSKSQQRGTGNLSAGAPLRAKIAARAAQNQIPLDAAFGDSSSPRALRLMRKVTLAARIFHRDGDAKTAIEMCRAVLLSDGRNVPARELLSEVFAAQGRLELAVMMLDQAIQIAPEDLFLRRKRDHLESARFPNGMARPIPRPSLWQRLRARLKRPKRSSHKK